MVTAELSTIRLMRVMKNLANKTTFKTRATFLFAEKREYLTYI